MLGGHGFWIEYIQASPCDLTFEQGFIKGFCIYYSSARQVHEYCGGLHHLVLFCAYEVVSLGSKRHVDGDEIRFGEYSFQLRIFEPVLLLHIRFSSSGVVDDLHVKSHTTLGCL